MRSTTSTIINQNKDMWKHQFN